MLTDRNTGNSRGVAVARFATEDAMNKAIEAMNEKPFEGQVITIRQFIPGTHKTKAQYREENNSKSKTFDEEPAAEEKPVEEVKEEEEEKPAEEEEKPAEEKKEKKDKKDKKEKKDKKKEKKDKE